MSKNIDLQPWLNYFDMLQQYERKGFLEVKPDEHEAYVTQPSLHAMTPGDDPTQQLRSGAIGDTLRRIRTYTGWKGMKGVAYTEQPFALHVIKDEPPHDPLYTLLMSPRLHRWPWQKKDTIEIIKYDEQ